MIYNDPIDITHDMWCEILNDKSVTTEIDISVLKHVFNSPNHEARGSEVAASLGMSHHGPLNILVSRFSKRVIQKYKVDPPVNSKGKPRWWHVPFLGYEKDGRFPWIMRPELVTAVEEVFDTQIGEISFLDEVEIESSSPLTEGLMKQVFVNRYERNRKARSICISHYGAKCMICGFDFEEVYGPIGKNKIHVHHVTPIAKMGGNYKVNPLSDLRPVCPNCHTIIHSKYKPFTIEEVKEILSGRRNGA